MAFQIPSNDRDLLSAFNSIGQFGAGSPAGQPVAAPVAFAQPQQFAPRPIARPAFQSPQAGGATVGSGNLQAGAADKDTGSLADRVKKFAFKELPKLGGGGNAAGVGAGTTTGGTNSGAHAQKAGAGIAAAAAGVEAGLAASAGGAALGAAAGEGALAAILLLL